MGAKCQQLAAGSGARRRHQGWRVLGPPPASELCTRQRGRDVLQVWASTCLSPHCISRGGAHPPTRAAPTGPSRSQNLSALDNILLFLNDPHPSGEGRRKSTGKVPCLGCREEGREAERFCKSLLGELVSWKFSVPLGRGELFEGSH